MNYNNSRKDLAEKIIHGDIRAASRLISEIEDCQPEARQVIKQLCPYTGKSHIVGITGAAGVGKSTIIDGLIGSLRRRGKTVGVIAVDPTSPFSGGALLGDRLRMQNHSEDAGVFIRSLATRGSLGGLADAVSDAATVLDAMGKEIILIETVGAGQEAVEIMNYAHTVVVVLIPGMGDEIQARKAGIMEIADIFAINKADRDDVRKLLLELGNILDVSERATYGWKPPVIQIANKSDANEFGEGISELADNIHAHHDHLLKTDLMDERLRRNSENELIEALKADILERIISHLASSGELDRMIDAIIRKESSPHELACEIIERYLKKK
jgi:LAO/AO transport system kinase